MRNRINLAIASLHISAGIYVLIALLLFPLVLYSDETGYGLAIAMGLSGFCLALCIGIEVVALGLRNRKFWAWIAGLCIFSMYVPSLFLPLGALGLWGLLDEGSRAEFGVKM